MTKASALCNLVRFAEFPEVVTLGPVADLKARARQEGDSPSRATEAELRALLELYFIDHPDNRRAWDALIGSMARVEGPGRGFLISGAYGSGKSHVLAALSLLAEHPPAWEHFLRSHSWMRNFSRAFGAARKLASVAVPLDDYRGSAHDLESIVFRCIEDELRQRLGDDAPALVEETSYLQAFENLLLPHRSEPFSGFLAERGERREWERLSAEDQPAAVRLAREFIRSQGIEVAIERPRSEVMTRLREALRGARFTGLVVLIDELSLFLASKDKRGLDEDAAFLQFLGQQSRAMPLWVVTAAQRELEDVGDIDSHSLRQIRDRYERHHLALAQLRTVVERKLVEKPDPHAFGDAIREACAAWAGGDGRLRFAPEELARTYPFNPLALEAFEGAAESFLSQTRSVVQAVGRAVGSGMLTQGAHRLISADAAFDFAAERLEGRPELHRFEAARRFYVENAKRIAADEPELVIAVFKALALAALGGVRWMVSETADALAGSAVRDDAGGDFYPCVERALRAMRRRGAYVERVSQEGAFADQYYLELASDVGEALRRRLYEIMDALGEKDSRVFENAAAACQDASFPLPVFSEPRQQQFEWMNTVRRATVERRDLRRVRAEELSRITEALASAGTAESGWLVIGDLRDVEAQGEAWLQVTQQVSGRWTQGALAWLPRPLGEDELDALREHAALRMLSADPTSREGEHGRELAQRVAERLTAQSAEAARIVRQAYAEGELLRADGRREDISEMAASDAWEETLAAILDWPMRELYPKFRDIAPRKRLAGKQRSTFVIEQFLRAGTSAPPPDSALEDALVSYLEPLGLARRDDGRWVLAIRDSVAAQAVLESVPMRASADAMTSADMIRFADCAGAIEKSEWGITPEMVELVIGSLVRAGYLIALDGFLKPIPFAQLGTPLSDHIAYLARATPLAAEHEQGALAVARALSGDAPHALDFEVQSALWERLCNWARDITSRLPELEQRLTGFYSALGQGPAEWAEARRTLAAAQELAGTIERDADAAEGLAAVAARSELAGAVAGLAALVEFLRDDADLAALMFRYLGDARLRIADAGPAAAREEILSMLAAGERIIPERTTFRQKATALVADYAARYQRHHAEVHSVARFRAYADARRAAEFRALLALARLGLSGRAADVEANLRAQMERHCAGGRLHEALLRGPTCPDCGLALGEDIELVAPEGILAACREALKQELSDLATRLGQLESALHAETDPAKAAAVKRALDVPPDASAESVLDAFSPVVVEWLAAALQARAASRAAVAELQTFLRGKRLTREQALRAFGEWLSAHGAAQDGDTVEFE